MKADRRYPCNGIIRQGRFCGRAATRHFVRANGICVKHYCAQHAKGAGVMKLLLPLPWEFDRVEVYGANR
jgi:hypothetical protein